MHDNLTVTDIEPVAGPTITGTDVTTIAAPFTAAESDAESRPAGFAALDGYVAEARSRTVQAEAFDLAPVIARYRREQGFADDIIADHHRELVRFLALCATAVNRGKAYGMMGAIDELWHTFVIFTQDYARFCDAVAGRFLHHVPEAEGTVSAGTIEHYLAFLADYEAVYGEAAPTTYWPRPTLNAFSGTSGEACKGCSACSGCGSGGSCTVH